MIYRRPIKTRDRGSMTQKADNLLRLFFDTHAQYTEYARTNARMLQQIWLWHETMGNQEEPVRLNGVCDICACVTTYETTSRPARPGDHFAFRGDWWLGLRCGCGTHSLDRAVHRALLDSGNITDRIYHVGHYSAVLRWMAGRGALNVTTSQYERGRRPGEIENGVRYEDLARLSFPNCEFDCIIATEVLEHIPDHMLALREMVRVLRPGGRALLTFPWLGGEYYEHLTRAEMLPDGTIRHILEPEYHGDPASPEGILSFRAFGWKILDEMRAAGFSRASAKFTFGPLHGHMTLQHPVIVGVR